MYKEAIRYVICNDNETRFYGYFTDGNLIDAKFFELKRFAEETLEKELNKELFSKIIQIKIQVYKTWRD